MAWLDNRRRRSILIACAVLASGGYASYTLYRSEYISRKRRQLAFLLHIFSRFGDACSNVVETTALLSSDLEDFVKSNTDEVPQSLKQIFKVVQCPEFQEAFVCCATGLFQGLGKSIWGTNPSTSALLPHRGRKHPPVRRSHSADRSPYSRRSHHYKAEEDSRENFAESSESNDGNDLHENSVWKLQGSKLQEKHKFRKRVVQARRKENKSFFDGLIERLSSGAGKGLVCIVAGSAARSFVLSIFEGMHTWEGHDKSKALWDSLKAEGKLDNNLLDSIPKERSSWSSENIFDLACTVKGRSLIAECIQTFIGTAVAVYLDKTRDINIYEQLIEGLTMPNHEKAAKDLINSICSKAVETLVRTTAEVIREEKPASYTDKENNGRSDLIKWESATASSSIGPLLSDTCENFPASEVQYKVPSLHGSGRTFQGSSDKQTWLHSISRTVAIPSNRQLIIDMVRTITSEAVRSTVDVLSSTFSLCLRQASDLGAIGLTQLRLEQVSKEVTAKALIILTICLVLILHSASRADY